MRLSSSTPQSQPMAKEGLTRRRLSSRTIRFLLLAVVIIALVSGAIWWRTTTTNAPTLPPATVPVTWGNLDVTVSSSGSVQPTQSINLSFQTSGQVKEVLVKVGDKVEVGQVLARLDDQQLRLQVQQAEADLQIAQAQLDKAKTGSATPEEIAQARANLQAAQAQLQQTRTGNVTQADIANAEASLRSAQAKLDALKNPSPDKISAAELTLTRARENLESIRTARSAAKTRAQQDLNIAANAVRTAQEELNKIYWDTHDANGNFKLSPGEPGYEALQSRYNDAVRAEQDAQARKAQAEITFNEAVQQEIVDVREAEAAVADAQAQLNALRNPSPNDIVQAQAAVDQARANLAKLRQGGTSAEIASAQAQIDRNQAQLDALTAPSSTSDIAIAEASVIQAQAKLETAKSQLANATLTAPFNGIVANVSIIPGDIVGSGGNTPISLIDTSSLYLELQISESEIMQIEPGQNVKISFETVPDETFRGTIDSVAPAGVKQQNLTTYTVRVRFDPQGVDLKVGLTGDADITVERRENVIQVPNRALKRNGNTYTVQVQRPNESAPATIPVEVGISNGVSTEIVRCITTNDQCLKEGDQLVLDIPGIGDQQAGQGQMIRLGEGTGDPSNASGPPIPVFQPAP